LEDSSWHLTTFGYGYNPRSAAGIVYSVNDGFLDDGMCTDAAQPSVGLVTSAPPQEVTVLFDDFEEGHFALVRTSQGTPGKCRLRYSTPVLAAASKDIISGSF
jgi:hypothetical protein